MKARKQAKQRQWMRMRIWMVGCGFGLALAVLAAQAFSLQVLRHEELSARAEREFLRRVELAPRRGIIYDRNQEELAVSLDSESVYASPAKVAAPARTGRKLARTLGLDPRKITKRLKGQKRFVWVARRVSPEQAAKVRALGLGGVGLMKEPRRFYPNSNLACHVLGFAGLDARGLEGLERRYDKVLRGQGHIVTSLRDALGRRIHLTPAAFGSLPEGSHLILTLDKGLQYQAEKILANTVARHKAKGGQVVVINPRTGEILAMAGRPVFNPNVFQKFAGESYRNRSVTDAFEPGSTFKMFVAAAALKSRLVSLERRFDCEGGKWELHDRVIHDTHPHELLNLAQIIKFSSNIGTAKVGRELGAKRLYKTFSDFGFGKRTGVDLPGESRGILRPAQDWTTVDMANICFGQGLAVTALQLVCAVGAVANGGVMMKPFIVRAEVDDGSRLVWEARPQTQGRVLGARESRILTVMLQGVTEPGGTGVKARIPGIPVAGKTGTAQKVDPKGGYSKTDFIASFVGFAPADDPRVAALVLIDTPKGKNHYGGSVAGPAFARITRCALDSLGVHRSPRLVTADAEPAQPQAAPAVNSDTKRAARAMASGRAPDLTGLTLRQVLSLSRQSGLTVKVRGWGRVVSQTPRPGARLGRGLGVRLAPAFGRRS